MLRRGLGEKPRRRSPTLFMPTTRARSPATSAKGGASCESLASPRSHHGLADARVLVDARVGAEHRVVLDRHVAGEPAEARDDHVRADLAVVRDVGAVHDQDVVADARAAAALAACRRGSSRARGSRCRAPISRRVGSPANVLSCGSPPTTANGKMRRARADARAARHARRAAGPTTPAPSSTLRADVGERRRP